MKTVDEAEASLLVQEHLEFLKAAHSKLQAENFTREDAIWVLSQGREWLQLLEPVLDFYQADPKFVSNEQRLSTNLVMVLLALTSVENILLQKNPQSKWWMA